MPFVKGQSGNPSGRPKGAKGLAERIRLKTRNLQDLVDTMVQIAQNGEDSDRINAIKWLADRALGRVADSVSISHSGSPPAPLQVPWKQAQ